MLKNIPKILSPELVKTLMEMGHGDEIVLGDGNFPAETCGRRVVRCDGLPVPALLDAILQLFPLDTYVDAPVMLMETAADDAFVPAIWETYKQSVEQYAPGTKIAEIERFAFYERAKAAYCVVATGEEAIYANIILKKGVVRAE